MPRNGRYRLLAGAALVAGVAATATPATAAQPADPSHGNTIAMNLPKLGARSAPFSAATRTADIAATPWVVGILFGNDPTAVNYCTGTIVSPTKVVTSASCSVPRVQNTVEVVAGRNNLADDSVGYADAVTSTMMTVDWNGYLKVYSANGTGGWINGNGTLIGAGFSSMRSVF
ncbi:MAG TPA: trypsin-like serine protease [Pseudonocardiaceae bacterium]|jgi:hypothetical protein|nr:trypsin-like serine protease [Pseudonocardiaceae bacterium]